jgi:hypothetical protein
VVEASVTTADEHARRAVEVLARSSSALPEPPSPAPFHGRSPLVGREAEVAELRAVLDDAAAGSGALVLVTGEAGIGKTRLTDELADEARERGFRVLRGTGWEAGGAPAYWPWIQVLRSYLRQHHDNREAPHVAVAARVLERLNPTQPAAVRDVDSSAFEVFDLLASFVLDLTTAEPVLLVLDDLHAADEATLLAVQVLGRQVGPARLVVVAGYRPSDARDPAVAAVLTDLQRDGRALRLGPLARAHVADLLEHVTGRAPKQQMVLALHTTTGGNAFFLEQILRLLETQERLDDDGPLVGALPIPDEVRDVVRLRLRPLPPEVVRVLRIAAVVGRDAPLSVLQEVAGLEVAELLEQLGEAVDIGVARLVDGPPPRLEFVHSLLRDTLYADLAQPERLRVHRRVADVLEQRSGGVEPPYDELAHHHLAAGPFGDVDWAVRCSRIAAVRALAVHAYHDAVSHLEQASGLLERRADPLACEVLLELGEARRRAGGAPAARATFVAAAERADAHASPEQFARAALGYAGSLGGYGFVDRADRTLVGLLERALQQLPDGDSVLRARLLARLAVELYYTPLRDRREELSRAALEMAARLDDDETLVIARYSRQWCRLGPDDLESRLQTADEMLALATRLDDLELLLRAHHLRMITALELGDRALADAELDSYARVAGRARQPAYEWHLTTLRAMRAHMAGALDEAERLAFEALDLGRRVQGDVATVLFGVHVCTLRWSQGRLAEVEPAIRLFVEQYPSSAWGPALVLAALAAGRRDEARAAFRRLAEDDFAALPRDGNWLVMLCHLAVACADLADADAARRLARLLEPYAERIAVANAGAACYGSMRSFLGILAATTGDVDGAVEQLEAGIERNLVVGHHTQALWTTLELSAALRRRGAGDDAARAAALLDDAQHLADAYGLQEFPARYRATPAPPADLAPRAEDADGDRSSTFALDGNVWVARFDGRTITLRDGKGPRYLARLLTAPGQEVLALDLVAGDGASAADAKEALRRQVLDVADELHEAREHHDGERIAALEHELDALRARAAEVLGLSDGDADADLAAAMERARVSVTKVLRATLRRIAEEHAGLGQHLDATVRTGTYCVYAPDPRAGVVWRS